MPKKRNLAKFMSETEFVSGYRYVTEFKAFAKSIGISPVTTLRKDELELLILEFLRTGTVKRPTRNTRDPSDRKDYKKGLSRALPVVHYTNDPETKVFLRNNSIKIDPDFRPKAGAMSRLNRCRDRQWLMDILSLTGTWWTITWNCIKRKALFLRSRRGVRQLPG